MLETISAPFTFLKKGIYYFSRRVPRDLHGHYKSGRITFSLRTRSAIVAGSRAALAARRLDEHWYQLRIYDLDIPGRHLLRETVNLPKTCSVRTEGAAGTSLKLSEGLNLYLRFKEHDRPKTFRRAAERACGYLIDACGDKELTAYSRVDANNFRDILIQKGLAGSSISRLMGTIRSVFNFATAENGISVINPFASVNYDRNAGVRERKPLSIETIRLLQAKCREHDDDLRWLVALVSDTGLRLAEAAGLAKNDLQLESSTPHVIVQHHSWRRLKTRKSARKVPLVGASLWAATRLLDDTQETKYAFPRYNLKESTNANSASAAANKWIKRYSSSGCTMHSFRHSMRDRLRAVECPSDIVDQIGGWQTDGIGQSYGTGYPVAILTKWIQLIS
ncbi:MAG: DUF6538 domain-containing protein [Pseudomonadota bacterium]